MSAGLARVGDRTMTLTLLPLFDGLLGTDFLGLGAALVLPGTTTEVDRQVKFAVLATVSDEEVDVEFETFSLVPKRVMR